MDRSLWSALVAEFIGTFALILIGAGTVALGIGGLVGVAFAHGLVIVAFAYAYGHVSGTHLNPAVTLGVWLAGRIAPARALGYMVVQLLGGLAGAFILCWLLGGNDTGLGATRLAQGLVVGTTTITITPAAGVALEAILTFFLVNTIMNAGISGKATPLDGLAVGFTLVFAILMGGPLTDASLNPARSLGPAVATGDFTDLWVYFVGPALGAAVAALLYRGLLAQEKAVS